MKGFPHYSLTTYDLPIDKNAHKMRTIIFVPFYKPF